MLVVLDPVVCRGRGPLLADVCFLSEVLKWTVHGIGYVKKEGRLWPDVLKISGK